ncbi:MAG: tRNA 4-thiouridine(8) synthase ThiI, partial [Ruminococcaceae bacterium]|nr:tRNA 4-thiouridine(8) synthase ThiI [Oscillospiraceae bacterium]
IGMDKEEIVEIARKIETFETSVLPYEDCCTIFTPRHPLTKPKLENIVASEKMLDFAGLVDAAVDGVETVVV